MKAWERLGRPVAAVAAGACFYYFLAVPLIAEYAYAGTLAAVALAAGLLRAVPRPHRPGTAALVLAFLLTLEAVDNLQGQPPALRLGGVALLLVAYPLLARLAAGVPARATAPAVAAAALLGQALLPSLYPVLTGFVPLWVSPPLTAQDKIPFFTPLAADLDGDGRAEIAAVTMSAPAPSAGEAGAAALLENRFAYRVFRWERGRMVAVPPDALPAAARRRLTALGRNEHAGAPVLSSAWAPGADGLPGFTFRPVADPFQAVTAAAPARLPFVLLGLNLRSVAASHESWLELQRRAGDPAAPPALDPLAPGREVAWIAATADLDGDGRLERLVNLPDRNAFVAGPDGLDPLWRAPNDSLRFAGFGRVGRDGGPVILAQDKGRWGFDPRRYLGGYRLAGGRLERLWKVFVPGVIHPAPADVNGDGANEIVAALWGTQRLVVLARHAWPVTQGVWALTLAIVLWPALRRGLGRRPGARPGGLPAAAAALAAAAIVLAAGRLPSPGLRLDAGAPPAPPDAGAVPAPEARRVLAEAAKRMAAIDRFAFQEQTVSYLGERRLPTATGGAVAKARMSLHGSIWGDTYYAYQDGNRLHLGFRTWHRRTVAAPPPASLGATLAYLPELAGTARRLPGTELVQRTLCRVYVLDADAAAVLRLIPDAVAPPAPLRDPGRMPGTFQVKVWVGEADGLIRQVQTFFDLPLPEATGLRQKTLVWFGSFNDPKLEIEAPTTVPVAQSR